MHHRGYACFPLLRDTVCVPSDSPVRHYLTAFTTLAGEYMKSIRIFRREALGERA